MGRKYVGGGYLTGIPRRDMTDAEVDDLRGELREIVIRSPFYEPVADAEVKKERLFWQVQDMRFPKLLVFTPTLRFEPETRGALFDQNFGGRMDWYVTRDNPHPREERQGYANILHNLNKARDLALGNGYEAMCIIESDVMPPPWAVSALVSIEADVAGGLYPLRSDNGVMNTFIHVPNQSSPGAPLEAVEIARAWGKQIRTNGVCMGCVLIWRHVLEQIPFRLAPNEAPAPDWYFMEDCNAAGMVTVCDLRVICAHKMPDGIVLKPESDGTVGRYLSGGYDSATKSPRLVRV